MATDITGDWRELFDIALFEPNRARLRQRIKCANNAIRNRLNMLMHDLPPNGQAKNGQSENDHSENGRIVSERIALRDALTTLAELHRIVYARKSSRAGQREGDGAAGRADL
jgi:hypothetical protein